MSHRPPQASPRPAWGILVTPDSPPVSSSHWEDLLCFWTGAACVRLAGLSGDVRCRLSLSHFHGRGAIYPLNSFPGGWGCRSLARKSIEKLRSLRKVTGPCGKCSGPAGPWVPPGHCPGVCTAILGHRWRHSELSPRQPSREPDLRTGVSWAHALAALAQLGGHASTRILPKAQPPGEWASLELALWKGPRHNGTAQIKGKVSRKERCCMGSGLLTSKN